MAKGMTNVAKDVIPGWTSKALRKRVEDTLIRKGVEAGFALQNVLTTIGCGLLVAKAKRDVLGAIFDGGFNPKNDLDWEYHDLILSEITRTTGGRFPKLRPYILSVMPLCELTWDQIVTDLAQGKFTSDAEGVLQVAVIDDKSAERLSREIGSVWKFVHAMPRMLTTVPVIDPETGKQKTNLENGVPVGVTVDIPTFGLIRAEKGGLPDQDAQAKYWAFKRRVREHTLECVAGTIAFTPQMFCDMLASEYKQFFEPKQNARSREYRFVASDGTKAAGEAPDPIDNVRSLVRSYAGTLAAGGDTGLYFACGVPGSKIDSVIATALANGFDARVVSNVDKGIDAQVRISRRLADVVRDEQAGTKFEEVEPHQAPPTIGQ